jgi:hypothetical protein
MKEELDKENQTVENEVETFHSQPVIVKQFDFDELLSNPLVEKLLTAGANWLTTDAETSKLAEQTEQQKINADLEVVRLDTQDKQHERRFQFWHDITNKIYSILIFVGLCGLFIMLWKMEILDKSAVQTLIPLFAVLIASGTNFKNIFQKNNKDNSEKQD